MEIMGVALAALGVYGLLQSERVLGWLDKGLYKRETKATKSRVNGLRILAALWALVGALIFLKAWLG